MTESSRGSSQPRNGTCISWVSHNDRHVLYLGCREIKPVSPEYSLEGLMLKLKLQYFGHLMRRTDSLEETLMLRIS